MGNVWSLRWIEVYWDSWVGRLGIMGIMGSLGISPSILSLPSLLSIPIKLRSLMGYNGLLWVTMGYYKLL